MKSQEIVQLFMEVPQELKDAMDRAGRVAGLSFRDIVEAVVAKKQGARVPPLYSVSELARAWGVSYATVRRLIARNPDVPIIKRGKCGMRISEESRKLLISRMGA